MIDWGMVCACVFSGGGETSKRRGGGEGGGAGAAQGGAQEGLEREGGARHQDAVV